MRNWFLILGIMLSCGSTGASTPVVQPDKGKYAAAIEEDIVFYALESAQSDKKIRRRGVLVRRPHAKGTVLICHGFMCDKYDVSFLHMLFCEYNSMSFDFRAHGEDLAGQVCTFGRNESYEVAAAVEFIRNHEDLDGPIFLYGFSMGAAAGIIAQAREQNLFDAMILDCPFDSTDKLLDRGIGQLKFSLFGKTVPMPGARWLRKHAYGPYVQSMLCFFLKTFTNFGSDNVSLNIEPVFPEEAIKHVDVPCFFIACVNDDKAPVEAVLTVYDGARGYKRCWIDPAGRKHFDTIFRQMHRYFYKVDRFLAKVVDGSYMRKPRAKISKDTSFCVLTDAQKFRPVVDSF